MERSRRTGPATPAGTWPGTSAFLNSTVHRAFPLVGGHRVTERYALRGEARPLVQAC